MEEQFKTLEDMIAYIYCSDKEEIRTKTDIVIRQIGTVSKESTEECKGENFFTLIIALKYYLLSIQEYKRAYDLYRDILDKHYANYLKRYEVLDGPFLFAIQVELICAMNIGTISKELKLMSMLIDIEALSVFEKYDMNDLIFNLGKESIEACGYFIMYIIKNKELEEKELINRLLSYLNACYKNLYEYTEISYYYLLEEIKATISENVSYQFCTNIMNFYSILFAYVCKEDLRIRAELKTQFNENYVELEEEYKKHKDIYNFCDKHTLDNALRNFLNTISEDDVKIYSDNICNVIKNYDERITEYTNEDVFSKLSELKKADVPEYKINLIDKYVCEYCKEMMRGLFELKHYKEIIDLYKLISDSYFGKKEIFDQFYFELAYSFSKIGEKAIAKQLYKDAIDSGKESSAVYNNLGVFYAEDGDNERALVFYKKAYELNPEDDVARNNKENIEKVIKETKEKEQKLRNAYFKRLQKRHKSILFTIHRYSDEVTDDVLYKIINQEKYSIRKNINFLIEHNMLQLGENGEYKINPTVEKWLDEYVNPTLERQIVKVDNSKLYRSIFYHESEINLYRVLIELFPQHLIFPNVSLKTIFDIDKLKELLEQEVISYLFKAHVDFTIINTVTYFPVLAFEKDSEYNDKEPSKTNNQYKNQIFKIGGIPLIRLRYNSGMDYEQLKQEVKDATKDLILEIENGSDNFEFDLLKEIDKKKFGIINSAVDLNVLQKEWDNIVGSGIAIKSKVIDVEDRGLVIEISNDLKAIIEISKDNINKKIMEKFSFIDDVRYNWY